MIYTRISKASVRDVSTGKRDDAGVRRQEEECRALAHGLGLEVVCVLRENNTSAYDERTRPQYRRMLDMIRNQEVDAVLVWHADRLYRVLGDLVELTEAIRESNVPIHTVRSGLIDLSTANGRLQASITGSVAQHESEQKSERLRAQRAQAAKEGRWNGGPRTYGYTTAMEVVPHEAQIIREIAERLLSGDSLRSVVADLNARGVPTARGGTWRSGTVRSLAAAARLSGQREHTPRSEGRSYGFGEIVGDGDWEAILTKEQTHRLRRLLSDPKRRTTRPSQRLLSAGVLRCGRCGHPMNSRTAPRGRWRYACIKTPGTGKCGSMSIVGQPLDELVSDAMLLVLSESPVPDLPATQQPDDDANIMQQVAEAEGRLDELAEDYTVGLISRREYMSARQRAQRHIQELQDQLTVRTDQVAIVGLPGDWDGLRTYWNEAHLDRRRAVLAAMVDRVNVLPAQHRGRPTFDSDRVEIVWRA